MRRTCSRCVCARALARRVFILHAKSFEGAQLTSARERAREELQSICRRRERALCYVTHTLLRRGTDELFEFVLEMGKKCSA